MKRILTNAVSTGGSLLLMGALLAGCASGAYQPIVKFGKLNVEAQLPEKNLVVLDTVEGNSRMDSYVLGLVQIIDGGKWQVLGIRFFEDEIAAGYGPMGPCPFFDPVAARAYSKALQKTPNADAVIEHASTTKVAGFPLFYERREVTFRGKAIQIKPTQ